MKIERSESLIIIIKNTNKKMILLALKFQIINGELFAYNYFLPLENRKLLKVTKVNGVDISKLINKIKVDDLYDIERMKILGIDTTKSFACSFNEKDNEIEYDLFNPNTLGEVDSLFFKPHEINKNVIINSHHDIDETNPTDNTMLEYSSTNSKALLIILKDMCHSETDQFKLAQLLQLFNVVNDNYTNVKNNLDMIFVSTQLLMLDDKLNHIPEYIEWGLKKNCIFDSEEELLKNNNAILTNNEIDYKKVMKMIRNCIAHSNYKVSSDGNVEFYNEGKNKMHFTIKKNKVIILFEQLYDYYFLDGVCPIVVNEILDHTSFNEESLIDNLKNKKLLYIDKYSLRKFDDAKIQNIKDADFRYDIDMFKSLLGFHEENVVVRVFNRLIKNYLNVEQELIPKKMENEDIMDILSEINEMGEEHFYSLGRTAQNEIINDLLMKKYNRNYYYFKKTSDIIENEIYSNQSLTNSSSDYINYKGKIEILITSFLNNLMLFCYNQNKLNLETEKIRFPMSVYKDYLDFRIEKFYETSKEASDYQFLYLTLLKALPNDKMLDYNLRNMERELKKSKNKLIKIKHDISNVNNIISGMNNGDEFKLVNNDILNRIRDCLAHGKLCLKVKDINNIIGCELVFVDEYDGQLQFRTSIAFGEFIDTIMEEDFIKSLTINNLNFNSHLKK